MDVLHAPPLPGLGWLARLDQAGRLLGIRHRLARPHPATAREAASAAAPSSLDAAARRDLGLPADHVSPRAQAARLWALTGPAG